MIHRKKDLNLYIQEDSKVAGVKHDFIHRIYHCFFPIYTFLYIKLLRKSTYYSASKNSFLKLYGFLLSMRCYRLATKLGFYIPKDVFGPGLFIPHHGSVVVNPNAKIGSYCQINNNVVIGQVNGKCPVIGDNVFIGAGAVICGDITIADNVWIGANSVVTKSVLKSGVLVVGAPARVIKEKENNWVHDFNIN